MALSIILSFTGKFANARCHDRHIPLVDCTMFGLYRVAEPLHRYEWACSIGDTKVSQKFMPMMFVPSEREPNLCEGH